MMAAAVGPIKPGTAWEGSSPKRTLAIMYGSIVKFTPKGGMVHLGGENPFKGEPDLDPDVPEGYKRPLKQGNWMGWYAGGAWAAFGIQMAMLYILVFPAAILGLTALSAVLPDGLVSCTTRSPR